MLGQLVCHLIGDFVLQNDYIARHKPHNSYVCGFHVLIYTLVFLFVTWSLPALLVIAGTHFVIDRFRLGVHWCNFYGVGDPWLKDGVYYEDTHVDELGVPTYRPPEPTWRNFWLAVIVDQTFHLACNLLAIHFLG